MTSALNYPAPTPGSIVPLSSSLVKGGTDWFDCEENPVDHLVVIGECRVEMCYSLPVVPCSGNQGSRFSLFDTTKGYRQEDKD